MTVPDSETPMITRIFLSKNMGIVFENFLVLTRTDHQVKNHLREQEPTRRSLLFIHNGIRVAASIIVVLLLSLVAIEVNGQATELSFTVQPSTITARATFASAVKVSILDSRGRVHRSASAPVTLRIGTNSGRGRLSGTATVNAVRGVATFVGLTIDKAASGYTLVASSSNLSVRAESAPFNVIPGTPSRLVFTVEPGSHTVAGVTFTAIQVAVLDSGGNTVASASNAITMALSANPSAGVLLGTTTVNAVNGVSRFPDLSIDKPGEGYTLVATSAGLSSATSDVFTAKKQEILIVSVGDSPASGEGNPDSPTVWGTCKVGILSVPCIKEPAKWQDEPCHRSARSGPAMAAQEIEDRDPDTRVRFVNLACSGATISNTVEQLKAAHQLTSGQQVDALIISAGGNDVGFVPLILICALLEDCYKTSDSYPHDLNEWIRNNVIGVDEKIKNLTQQFNTLDAAIKDNLKVNPSSVYITEYFDPTHDESRNFCHMLRGAEDIAKRLLEDFGYDGIIVDFVELHPRLDFDGITERESEWLFNHVVIPLNAKVAEAVHNHQKDGWNYVGSIMSAYSTHGACAPDNWIVRGKQSYRTQGNFRGTMHPNQQGQEVSRDRLVQFFLGGGQKLEVKPVWDARGVLYVSREEQGSFTGSCVFDASNPNAPLACMPEVLLTVAAHDPNGIGRTSVSIDGSVPTYRPFTDQFSARGGPHDLNGEYDCTSAEERQSEQIVLEDDEGRKRVATSTHLVRVTDVRHGLVCNLSRDNNLFEAMWFIKITANGTYHLAFTTGPSDSVGAVRTYPYEVKVGLQEQPPTGAGPHVVAVTLKAEPPTYRGLCPASVRFSGRISVDGPGLVSYRFVRSDGTKGLVEALTFTGAESEDVSTTWDVGNSSRTGTKKFEAWESIQILEPERHEARASFVATCDPIPPSPEDCKQRPCP